MTSSSYTDAAQQRWKPFNDVIGEETGIYRPKSFNFGNISYNNDSEPSSGQE